MLVTLLLFYIVGITTINPYQGERIRFPVLAFLMPVAAWNLRCLMAHVTRPKAS
jgi:hypothetical protein